MLERYAEAAESLQILETWCSFEWSQIQSLIHYRWELETGAVPGKVVCSPGGPRESDARAVCSRGLHS